ncbi:MAG: GNAT family protein [Anaerolineales bacterium]
MMEAESRLEQTSNAHKGKTLFRGELVYLVAPDPAGDAAMFAKWMSDSEFVRLLDTDPARLLSVGKHKDWLEKDLLEEQKNDELFFLIRTLVEERTIGLVGLDGIRWVHGDAWVGIGLGEREYWGKGYGKDAMQILQRYAFDELNLHRLSLTVFDYNQRAIRSYEKAGFIVEGRSRQYLNREGQRFDMIFMGILREEWENRASQLQISGHLSGQL